jgi:hypothetical protein
LNKKAAVKEHCPRNEEIAKFFSWGPLTKRMHFSFPRLRVKHAFRICLVCRQTKSEIYLKQKLAVNAFDSRAEANQTASSVLFVAGANAGFMDVSQGSIDDSIFGFTTASLRAKLAAGVCRARMFLRSWQLPARHSLVVVAISMREDLFAL